MALGGNALLRRGETPALEVQQRNARRAAESVAALARDHDVVVTHGNGPQVGLLALQSAAHAAAHGAAGGDGRPDPLDVLDAESEGLIGHLLELELRVALPGRELATLLTQVEVDAADPAFAAPSKPVGPVYPPDTARALAARHGWQLVPDGDGLRRVVCSPAPRRILALGSIRRLLDAGTLVVCAGGGGIPVVAEGGRLRGAEAVVDKDRTSALLAAALDCDALLLLTDVDAVYADWDEGRTRPFRDVPPEALRAQRFDPGSMGPKVEAACRFADSGRGFAAIGRLDDAAAILDGQSGTRVHLG